MGNIFNSTKAPPQQQQQRAKPSLSQQDQAILDLKIARDKLRRHQSKGEAESATLLKRAQGEYKKGDKKRAVYFMKIKKLKESKVDEIGSQLLNLEQMVHTIEWTTQSMAVVSAMERAQVSLTTLQKEMPVERVQELMDDVSEAVEMQQEIDRALAAGLPGSSLEEMEDELGKELEALAGDTQAAGIGTTIPVLPVAPVTLPVIAGSGPTLTEMKAPAAADSGREEEGDGRKLVASS
mmetsp:Transcript_17322/g.31806  ORF Transcript_17322/g.31806 Transcript_17322/m.31806 type:complete len:237 (+) Transcript_17322:66-776(+)